jgi:amino acid permease
MSFSFGVQIFWLVILSMVVASISWTVTQETIFEEWREAAKKRSDSSSNILARKFFYVWTCEYCFSHWVTILVLLVTNFRLLMDDWRGYVIAFFVLPLVANLWMSFYRRLRVEIKHENALAEQTIAENEDSGK